MTNPYLDRSRAQLVLVDSVLSSGDTIFADTIYALQWRTELPEYIDSIVFTSSGAESISVTVQIVPGMEQPFVSTVQTSVAGPFVYTIRTFFDDGGIGVDSILLNVVWKLSPLDTAAPVISWLSPLLQGDSLVLATLPAVLALNVEDAFGTRISILTTSLRGSMLNSAVWADSSHHAATLAVQIDSLAFAGADTLRLSVVCGDSLGNVDSSVVRLVHHFGVIDTTPIDTTPEDTARPQLSRISPIGSVTVSDTDWVSISVLATNLAADSTYRIFCFADGVQADSLSVSSDTLTASFNISLHEDTTIARMILMGAYGALDTLDDTLVWHAPVITPVALICTTPGVGDSLRGGMAQTVAGYVTGKDPLVELRIEAKDSAGTLASDTLLPGDSLFALSLTPADSSSWVHLTLYEGDAVLCVDTVFVAEPKDIVDTARVIRIVRTDPPNDTVIRSESSEDSLVLNGVMDGMKAGDTCTLRFTTDRSGTPAIEQRVTLSPWGWRQAVLLDTGLTQIQIRAALADTSVRDADTLVYVWHRPAIDSGSPAIVQILSGGTVVPTVSFSTSEEKVLDIIAVDPQGAIASVSVNGAAASPAGTSLWRITMPLTHRSSLVSGGDTLIVRATNFVGRFAEQAVVVIRNARPIFVDAPASRTINTFFAMTDTVQITDVDSDPRTFRVRAVYGVHVDTLVDINPFVGDPMPQNSTVGFSWKPLDPQFSGTVTFSISSFDGYETSDTSIVCTMLYADPDSIVISTPLSAFPDTIDHSDTALALKLATSGTITSGLIWHDSVMSRGLASDIRSGDSTSDSIHWIPSEAQLGPAQIHIVVSGTTPYGTVESDTLTKNVYVIGAYAGFNRDSSAFPRGSDRSMGVNLDRSYVDVTTIPVVVNTTESTAVEGVDFEFLVREVTYDNWATTGQTITIRIPPTARQGKKIVFNLGALDPGIVAGPITRRVVMIQ